VRSLYLKKGGVWWVPTGSAPFAASRFGASLP